MHKYPQLIIILIFLYVINLSGSSLERLAKMVAEETNKVNRQLSSISNGVKVFKTVAVGNTVINSKQELTKTSQELLSIQSRFISAYQEISCQSIKPLLDEGLNIKNKIYDKNGNLGFSFFVKCR